MEQFKIIIRLYAEIDTEDLHLGYEDYDNKFRTQCLQELDEEFSPELYVRADTFDKVIYSVRPELANPQSLLYLRDSVYSVCGINPQHSNDLITSSLLSDIEDFSSGFIGQLKESIYSDFKWISFRDYIFIDIDQWGKSLRMQCGGIQIVAPEEAYRSEYRGELTSLSSLLQKALPENRLNSLVSAFIL